MIVIGKCSLQVILVGPGWKSCRLLLVMVRVVVGGGGGACVCVLFNI